MVTKMQIINLCCSYILSHLILIKPFGIRCYHHLHSSEKLRNKLCKQLARGHTANKW